MLICGETINKRSKVLICELLPVEIEVCKRLVLSKGFTQCTKSRNRKTLILIVRAYCPDVCLEKSDVEKV